MASIVEQLSIELSLSPAQIQKTLQLFEEGATVPFVARYRKEITGDLNETTLRDLLERSQYLGELEERKKAILESISEQGKLNPELRLQISKCKTKAELEDLYLPFKPRKRTRATIAREKGLEPLAVLIRAANVSNGADLILEDLAAEHVQNNNNVSDVQEALQGAADILAEEIAERAQLRTLVRDYLNSNASFESEIKKEFPEGSTKYEMYRSYSSSVQKIPAHNMLALRRGETEGILRLTLGFAEDQIITLLNHKVIHSHAPRVRHYYEAIVKDAFSRLMKNSLAGEIRFDKKQEADEISIRTFASNLRELLLASPAGMKPTLGIDPGFRTGCKLAALGHTGQLLEYKTIFPHTGEHKKREASTVLTTLLAKHKIELIAIGNGTASRETDQFITECLATIESKPTKIIVSEAGASVYSASPVAIEEFPDLDVTVRGAISIARRLQDPLAELVKIDPKSIGVGQYQHDVDQKRLKQKLSEVVESCVNYVGVDVNTASPQLLEYVAGISPTIARNVVSFRASHGRISTREELLSVNKFGPKTFEQSAGFLRIRNGNNPLDNTGVHPESYAIANRILNDLGVPIENLTDNSHKLQKVDLQPYITDLVGKPTLVDILSELAKPGRDPRAEFKYASFQEGIEAISDLKVGMQLEGVVTNVTNFGAFVDIGVHQDGLVHISELADRYVKDPTKVVAVGQIVSVRVLQVDEQLHRIGLSMRKEQTRPSPKVMAKKKRLPRGEFSVEDLKNKFRK